MCRRIPGVIALFALAVAVHAQGPSADWRTVTTRHFRVHYPARYSEWSLRAASRLESIRDAVVREAGYDPPEVIDVVVSNPVASPNGVAWPLLDAPRILFYTEPPGPEEQIGSYSNFIDLLAVHEVTHIIHMLRPSRNPMVRFIERTMLPIGPITFGAPRWVLEGYATVVEGRLTGAGRPSSTLRAAILRKWAASGRLPSYAQLDSDSRFLGMSMAYLMGSAYLEWLDQRGGEGSLRRLWTRMTAYQNRSFDEAFRGVYGDSPERLYGQFTAELTASAVAVNRAGELREGELWQGTSWSSGDPAVSPDGSFIAVVIRKRGRPSNLVVWQTAPATAEEEKYRKRIDRLLARDPEDVAPVRGRPLDRKPLHTLTLPDGGDIESPRWTSDSRSIIYSHRQPDREGDLHHDLFRWSPGAGDNVRLTRLADVSDADPLLDGTAATAVRTRNGTSQLVRVSFDSGRVDEITAPSIDRVESHPRVSRDGRSVVYVSHRNGKWRLVRRELSSGDESELGSTEFSYASPEWNATSGDELFAVASAGGYAEIHRVRGTTSTAVTRSSGAAFSPAPASDGRVFFMALDPDGFNLRVIDGTATAGAAPPFDPANVPAVPPQPARVAAFATEPLSAQPYGIGRQEITSIFTQQFAPSQNAIEAGVRLGDVVGRLDTIAIGSFGRRDAQRGVAIASAWRGWPVGVALHAFKSEDRRMDRDGVELRGTWSTRTPRSSLALTAGGLSGKPLDIAFGQATFRARHINGSRRADAEVRAAAESGTFEHHRVVAAASVREGSLRLGVRVQRDQISDGALDVGGLASSVLPDSAYAARVFDPALPVGTLTGTRYQGIRFEAELPSIPFTMFYQRHETRSDSLDLAGIEISLTQGPLPILRLPAFRLTAGGARILDEPLKNKTKWWIGLRWNP